MKSPGQWVKEVKLGELYVLIHCQPLSSSMVLGLQASKRPEEEQVPARARMPGGVRDVAQNTRTGTEQERKRDRCYSRRLCCQECRRCLWFL